MPEPEKDILEELVPKKALEDWEKYAQLVRQIIPPSAMNSELGELTNRVAMAAFLSGWKKGFSNNKEILELAIQSVLQFKSADIQNDAWRERHKDWKELNKIVTDKEHLEVEVLYDRASDMMEEVVKLFNDKLKQK